MNELKYMSSTLEPCKDNDSVKDTTEDISAVFTLSEHNSTVIESCKDLLTVKGPVEDSPTIKELSEDSSKDTYLNDNIHQYAESSDTILTEQSEDISIFKELSNPELFYSKPDLERLYAKAKYFADIHRFNECRYLYRNKPENYFEDIRQSNSIMQIYSKDNDAVIPHGDPLSPINSLQPGERPRGLFFLANVQNISGNLPTSSNYGNTRFKVPVGQLIKDDTNMFFADFYCAGNRPSHYVTLIISKNGSHTDTFCERHLILLDKSNNSFLCLKHSGSWRVNNKVWVEQKI